jgi:hypothetical protein
MATINEILEAIKSASEEDKKAFKKALGVSEGSVEKSSDAAKRDLELELDRAKAMERAATLNNDMVRAAKERNKINKLNLETELAKQDFDQKQITGIMKKIALGKELSELEEAGLEHAKELAVLFKQSNEDLEDRKRILDDISEGVASTVNGMASLIGLQDKYSKSGVSKMTNLFSMIQQGGANADAAIAELTKSFQNMFSAQNIGMNVAGAIFEQSMKTLRAFDDASASLAKTTGTVDKFNNNLYDAQRAGNLLGVTMADVANSITALNTGTSNFAKLNESTRTELIKTTSQMEKLGVSATDTAAFMENAFKIMNMGATEAIEAQTELAMAGVQLGIGAEKIVKDFNSASKTLAVYGKESVGVFKNLAAQAKAAGVEVGTLLGIVQKFDTFSGAAEGAAQFNALLGTQLSTTQMLMMTEDERMKTLVESVQAQGVAFGDMDRFTQKAIAAAAGITDMNEANRIFGMSLADYEANAAQMQENADAQAKFDEAVQATVPTMNKFKNLATELIVMVQPVLEKLGEIADYLTDKLQGMSKETKETIATVGLLVGGLMAVMPLVAVGGGLFAGLTALGPAIAGVGTGIATAVSSISAAVAGTAGIGGGVILSLLAGGAMVAATIASMAESEAKVAEANAYMMQQGSTTIEAMRDISKADFTGVATKFKGVIEELNSMGTNVKVTAMLQNLALVSSGAAMDLTGAKISASTTNLNTTVKTMFEGATINLKAGGRDFEAYVEDVAANVAMSNGKFA